MHSILSFFFDFSFYSSHSRIQQQILPLITLLVAQTTTCRELRVPTHSIQLLLFRSAGGWQRNGNRKQEEKNPFTIQKHTLYNNFSFSYESWSTFPLLRVHWAQSCEALEFHLIIWIHDKSTNWALTTATGWDSCVCGAVWKTRKIFSAFLLSNKTAARSSCWDAK